MVQESNIPSRDKGERLDLRAELRKLEEMIGQLKMEYEQYFLGQLPLAPERLHNIVKRRIRELRKAPFRSQAINFKLKTLEGRYNTFNNYWQRVLKQREEGTYSRDVFKANLRERNALEDAWSQTAAGKAEKGLQNLFNSYKAALEKQLGQQQRLDFSAFQKSLIERAKQFKAKGQKVSFRVVVENGKVNIKAKVKSDNRSGE